MSDYKELEKWVNIAFPGEAVYRVRVTPRVPEKRVFTGYSNMKESHGNTEGWFVPRYFVVAREHTGWYRTHQVNRVLDTGR